MVGTPTIPLSVLDTAPVWAAASASQSLHWSVELAQEVERLGYTRYWLAEHHNTPSLATSATAVMIDRLASATKDIRVGSGGIMLPNHPPLVVAEQFGTLSALHSERIDLGIGRAPGTDPSTVRALRRSPEFGAADFSHQLSELMGYLDPADSDGIAAVPAPESWPPVWLLGTSPNSASLAGALGIPFAFAHHLRPDATIAALDAYRESFRVSAHLDRPYAIVATVTSVAETDERADWLLGPMKLAFAVGKPIPFRSPDEAAAYHYDATQLARIRAQYDPQLVGSPDSVRQQISELLKATQADELMSLTVMHDHSERVRSYELLAEAAHNASKDLELTAKSGSSETAS